MSAFEKIILIRVLSYNQGQNLLWFLILTYQFHNSLAAIQIVLAVSSTSPHSFSSISQYLEDFFLKDGKNL